MLSAYNDNAAVIRGSAGRALLRRDAAINARSDVRAELIAAHQEPIHILMKVETHNHPTAISPVSRRGHRLGRRDPRRGRDRPRRQAQGRADRLQRVQPAHSRVRPALGSVDYGKPERIASALEIMLEARSAAPPSTTSSAGPICAGYFRTFEQDACRARGHRDVRGYHKPIMIAGGSATSARSTCRSANSRRRQADRAGRAGDADRSRRRRGLVAWRPARRSEDLDFASVQRDNPEMERRCQEVIDRCWALGEDNPIRFIHDVGAGGSVQRPARAGQGRRARRALRAARRAQRRAGHVAAGDLVQRGAGALRAGGRTGRPCDLRGAVRARALPLRGGRRGHRGAPSGRARRAFRQHADRHAAERAARQAAADAARIRRVSRGRCRVPTSTISTCARRSSACCACRRWPTRPS